jgi:hypothetical protein
MTDTPHDECQESWLECTRVRQARVDQVIRTNPDATVDELAQKANVTRRTIFRAPEYKRKTVTPVTPVDELDEESEAAADAAADATWNAKWEAEEARVKELESRGIHVSNRPEVEIKVIARNEWQTKALENEPTTLEEATARYNAIGWETGVIERRAWELREAEGQVLMDAKRFFPTGRGHKAWLNSHKTCAVSTSATNAALWHAGYQPNGDPHTSSTWRRFNRLVHEIDVSRLPQFQKAVECLIAEYAAPMAAGEEAEDDATRAKLKAILPRVSVDTLMLLVELLDDNELKEFGEMFCTYANTRSLAKYKRDAGILVGVDAAQAADAAE